MTRKSKRELERAVDRLGAGDDSVEWEALVTFVDPETGEHVTPDGEVVDDDRPDEPALTVSIGGDPDR